VDAEEERDFERATAYAPTRNSLVNLIAFVIESSYFELWRRAVDKAKRLFINVVGILVFSIIGALLAMGLDLGGTRWLKFMLYVAFFASISSPAVFSSRLSCSAMLRRLRK